MNTLENNKLIAEFMNNWFEKTNRDDTFIEIGINVPRSSERESSLYWLTDLEFHNSWDWLMPVVDKIESIIFEENNFFNVTIGGTIYCVIQDSNGEVYDVSYEGEESKFKVVYKAVIEFIKWYNENKS